ncbi:MAG: NUDIX domain-containing protein, partial [Acidimicrobiia bacterium]|nr:NUDIX domain-containing protein [Acidimicrobiia bacterium]
MLDPRRSELRDLLVAYQPFDEREAAYLDAMLVLADDESDVLSRNHFVPGHFTASGFVLSPDRTTLLLVHHAKLDKWLQPGGHVEPEDAGLEPAARREVLEETGVAGLGSMGLIDIDIHQFPARGSEPAHDHLDVRFGFVAASDQVEAGEGTIEVRWFHLAEVASWHDRPSMSR